jgi:hypothetical protein
MNKVLAIRGARTPPTLPRMPTSNKILELIPNTVLAFPTTFPTTTLAGTINKHTVWFKE